MARDDRRAYAFLIAGKRSLASRVYAVAWGFLLARNARFYCLGRMEEINWIWFLGASAMLTLSPGPDNCFVIANGISRGKWPALWASWGMISGLSVHLGLAVLGVSALLASHPFAYQGTRVLGAVYLLYLAVQTLRHRHDALDLKAGSRPISGIRMYGRGFLMNVLNPKVGLFFIAYLPSFVVEGAGSYGAQMLRLGLVFALQALLLFMGISLISGALGDRLLQDSRWGYRLSWVSAAMFVGIALSLIR